MRRTAVAGRPVKPKISLAFINETIAELKKVTWPTRQETTRLTTIVVLVSAAVGLILGVVDWVFYWVINQLFLR